MKSAKRGLIASAAAVMALAGAAAADPVTGGKTQLVPDDDFFVNLHEENGIDVDVTGAARLSEDGTVVFPVSGVNFNLEAGRGTVVHRGGLIFTRPEGAFVKASKLTAIVRSEKTKVFARSRSDDTGLRLFDLDDPEILGTERRSTVTGRAKLAKEGAEVLSEEFNTNVAAGEVVGEMSIKVETEGGTE